MKHCHAPMTNIDFWNIKSDRRRNRGPVADGCNPLHHQVYLATFFDSRALVFILNVNWNMDMVFFCPAGMNARLCCEVQLLGSDWCEVISQCTELAPVLPPGEHIQCCRNQAYHVLSEWAYLIKRNKHDCPRRPKICPFFSVARSRANFLKSSLNVPTKTTGSAFFAFFLLMHASVVIKR